MSDEEGPEGLEVEAPSAASVHAAALVAQVGGRGSHILVMLSAAKHPYGDHDCGRSHDAFFRE